MYIRTINTDELNLLFQLFDYNNPDEMIAENTRDITEGKIDIFGLFQENRLIGELHAAYVHNDDRFAVKKISEPISLHSVFIRIFKGKDTDSF